MAMHEDSYREKENDVFPPVQLAIVSGLTLLTHALRHFLSGTTEIEVVGEGRTADDALWMARHLRPHVLLLHPRYLRKDVLDLVREIVVSKHGTRLMVLHTERNHGSALRLVSAGAAGILSESTDLKQAVEAIRLVARGRTYLTPEIERLCAERFARSRDPRPPEERLSDREYQVMRLLALGHTNREVGEILAISVKTVDTHRGNLLRKLGLRNNSDLTRFAIRFDYIDPGDAL